MPDTFKEKMEACGIHRLTDNELWDESGKPNRLIYPCEMGIDCCDLCGRYNDPRKDNYDAAIHIFREGFGDNGIKALILALAGLGALILLMGAAALFHSVA